MSDSKNAVMVSGYQTVRFDSCRTYETLYVKHYDDGMNFKIYTIDERPFSNDFPENGWKIMNGIVPPEAEFIGTYVINL